MAGEPLPKTINWVRPELVAEVQFASWSGSGRVRQAVYLGLREDKDGQGGGARSCGSRSGAQDRAAAAWRSEARKRGPVIAVPPRAGRAIVSARHRSGEG